MDILDPRTAAQPREIDELAAQVKEEFLSFLQRYVTPGRHSVL